MWHGSSQWGVGISDGQSDRLDYWTDSTEEVNGDVN